MSILKIITSLTKKKYAKGLSGLVIIYLSLSACNYAGKVDGNIGQKAYHIRDLQPAYLVSYNQDLTIMLSQQDNNEIRLMSLQFKNYQSLKIDSQLIYNKDSKNTKEVQAENSVDISISYGKPIDKKYSSHKNLLLINDPKFAAIQSTEVTLEEVPNEDSQIFSGSFTIILTNNDVLEGSFSIDIEKNEG